MLVLALESSTSAAKAMLYDSEQGVLAVENESYTPDMDENGRQDTELVYLATMRVGRKAAQGRDIEAISVGGVWHSITVCDTAMRPVIATHIWTYSGASELCRSVREDKRLARDIYNRTGCMPNITYQPYTLKYLQQQGLDLTDKFFFSQAGYNFYRMTVERIETYNIASGMGFLDIRAKEYEDLILDYIGIEKNQLSPLGTYRDLRPLSGECARLLGVRSDIPVVPPHSDGALNQLGNGAYRPKFMTFSVGTSAAIRLSTDSPFLSEPAATWCYVGVDRWLSGAATAGACNCVNWFKDTLMGGRMSFWELGEKLLDDDNETPVFLPFLFGERCPGWQDERMGGFHEIKSTNGAQDLFRGLSEGILFNIYQCYLILEKSFGKPEQIILSGGILNSHRWTQMVSDIWGQEITISKSSQASLLGGVVLALFAAESSDELPDLPFGAKKTISPRPDAVNRYRDKFERYLYWYNNVKK
jgi:gluconokinase